MQIPNRRSLTTSMLNCVILAISSLELIIFAPVSISCFFRQLCRPSRSTGPPGRLASATPAYQLIALRSQRRITSCASCAGRLLMSKNRRTQSRLFRARTALSSVVGKALAGRTDGAVSILWQGLLIILLVPDHDRRGSRPRRLTTKCSS